MDFERLEQVWRSEANRPSEEQRARLMEELMNTLKTRRRTEAIPSAASRTGTRTPPTRPAPATAEARPR